MRKHHSRWLWAALFQAALSVSAVYAQSMPSSAVTLSEVVVTGTRTLTKSNDQLSEVTLISRTDIERAGNVSLAELLGGVPGVQISPSSIRGGSTSIFIRGTNTTHTLFLVDGQRVSSATTGTTAFQHLPLDQIERIEILRGPASSLYGSDAIGGVVQIFTRSGTGKPTPQVSVSVGSYGTSSASFGYGGKVDGTSFHLQVGRENSRGFSDIKEAKGGSNDSYNSDRDGYGQSNLGFSLGHQVNNELELGATYLVSQGAKKFDRLNWDPAYTVSTANYNNRDRQLLETFALQATYQFNPAWKSTIKVSKGKDDLKSWAFNPLAQLEYIEKYTTNQNQFTWQNDVVIGGGILMAAFEQRDVSLKSTQVYDKSEQNTKSNVLGYQAWIDRHLVQISTRNDKVSGLASQSTYSAGYGYKVATDWIARGSMGTGFHAPTFNDLYWPLDYVNYYVGNPLLRPESSRNQELGITYESTSSSASLTFFKNQIKDLIVYKADPLTYLGSMTNLESSTIKGATILGKHTWQNWNVSGSMDILSPHDDSTGRVLPRRVARTAMLDLSRRAGPWTWGVNTKIFSDSFNDSKNEQKLPGYALVGLRSVYAWSRDVNLTVAIQNALDKDYVVNRSSFSPYSDYGTAGRALYVGLRYAPK